MTDMRFQIPGHPAAQWAASNIVLRARELAIETDTLRLKLGDGATAWNALPYLPDPITADPGRCRGHQLQIALLNRSVLQQLAFASPPDAVTIRWNTGAPVTVGDPLWASIKSQLGYSDAQMAALLAEAKAIS